MHNVDNLLISSSVAPRYGKTRWCTFSYAHPNAYRRTFSLDKTRRTSTKNLNFCSACACVMGVKAQSVKAQSYSIFRRLEQIFASFCWDIRVPDFIILCLLIFSLPVQWHHLSMASLIDFWLFFPICVCVCDYFYITYDISNDYFVF